MIITVDDDCIILKENKELERERERGKKEIDWNELETGFLSQVSQIPEQFESSVFFQSDVIERERERNQETTSNKFKVESTSVFSLLL